MTEFHNFRYSLAKKNKWVCPKCGKKTFVCYVDENGEVLDESVGKCDRADKCAHHYPPREYFKDNNLQAPRPTTMVKPSLPAYVLPSYIDPDIFKKSVNGDKYRLNRLLTYLTGFASFEDDTVHRVAKEYYIGTAKHWDGATVFWQVDQNGRVHAGKIMLYNTITGKRIKDPFPHVTWVHTVLGLQNFNLKQCLFGEHLLGKYPDKPVAVVESEKTAFILGCIVPQCVAVACGGCSNLTSAMCQPLRGRDVVLLPDNGKYDEWTEKGKSMAHMFKSLWISDFMEYAYIHGSRVGADIADYITQEYFSWKISGEGEVDLDLGLEQLK